MSKVAIGVGVTALAAAGVMVYLQQQDNRALRREIALLRAEVQMSGRSGERAAARSETVAPATAETAANDRRPRDEELGKLREEIAALRKSTAALNKFAEMATMAQSVKELEKGATSVATKLTPVGQWKNAGKATPEAASETALWAAAGGDVDTLSNTLMFTDTARAKADAWFATLSESTRQQYGSPEKVIALMIARDAASLTGMQVIGQKEVGPNDVGLRIRFAADEKMKDDTFLMRRSADGWRLLLPDQAVETFAKKLSGKR